jgi:hypothetical protein
MPSALIENARAYLGVAKCYASRGKVPSWRLRTTRKRSSTSDPQKERHYDKLYKEGGPGIHESFHLMHELVV